MQTSFHIFTVKFRRDLQRKLELNYHLPSNMLPHYLVKSKIVRLYSFTAQLIQFKVMKRRLVTVNVHEECYFFVYTC